MGRLENDRLFHHDEWKRQLRKLLKPIGILGGTFDPVHNGHLRLALEVFEALDLDHVRLTPLYSPGHRGTPMATPELRLEMLRAVEKPPIEVDICEIVRRGTSYTVDTLSELNANWPGRTFCLVMGIDSFQSLPKWHRANELLSMAHIVVASRPGSQKQECSELDELIGNAQASHIQDLHDTSAGRVLFLDIPMLPIASSDLRARCASGRKIRHLVPDAVCQIVESKGLYRE